MSLSEKLFFVTISERYWTGEHGQKNRQSCASKYF